MSTPPLEVDPQDLQEVFQTVAQGMADAGPPGWEVLRWRMTSVAGQSGSSLSTVAADGTTTVVEGPGVDRPDREAEDALLGLRTTLYRPGAGAWFTATATLTAQGAFDLDLGYDDEPQRDLAPFAPASYVTDLARYPRDPENVPAWLAAQLAAAAEEADLP